MKTTNTFGVRFFIRGNKIKNGKAPIYVRITVDGKRLDVSIKRDVDPELWSQSIGKAKGNRTEIKSLNLYLDKVKAELINIYQEMQLQKQFITADAVKNKFIGHNHKEHTLCKLMEYHNTSQQNVLAPGTLKNYFTTEKYVKMYLEGRRGTSDIYLAEMTYSFITDFEQYLRHHQPVDHQKPLGNNGIMKHLERLRKMMGMAVRMEWIKVDPFDKYVVKFHKVERGYLTEDELAAIENKRFTIERLQLVRDLFIFSCYTGLAYIDAMKLTPDDISIGMDGEYWIRIKRQKAEQPVNVPILPQAWTLIEKYKDCPRALHSGTVFPVLSNQKINGYLKEIADVCGIEKNLTFHLARHTFATTITLSNGVPIETVSKLLGHTKITTTQIYSKVIEKKVSEDMQSLRQVLSDKESSEIQTRKLS